MFGYVRPVKSELLVKDADFYSSVYCGLCRYGGKNISHLTRWMLNYDFVLLALMRIFFSDEKVCVELKKCPYKLKRKSCASADNSYGYVCSAFGLLTYGKLLDDIKDEKGFKRFIGICSKPFLKHIAHKADKNDGLKEIIERGLYLGNIAEEAKTASLDEAADPFAKMMSEIASFGIEGNNKTVASECGYHIGRFIYIADALDDIEQDEKSGNYNPLLLKYGNSANALNHINETKTTLYDSLNAFSNAFAIACSGTLQAPERLIFNITELGGREAVKKIIERKNKK